MFVPSTLTWNRWVEALLTVPRMVALPCGEEPQPAVASHRAATDVTVITRRASFIGALLLVSASQRTSVVRPQFFPGSPAEPQPRPWNLVHGSGGSAPARGHRWPARVARDRLFARAASGLRLPRRLSADVWFSATRIYCVRRSTVSSR